MNPDIHYREIAQVAAASAPVQWTRIEVPTEGGDHVGYSVLAYDDANTRHSYTIADYKEEIVFPPPCSPCARE